MHVELGVCTLVFPISFRVFYGYPFSGYVGSFLERERRGYEQRRLGVVVSYKRMHRSQTQKYQQAMLVADGYRLLVAPQPVGHSLGRRHQLFKEDKQLFNGKQGWECM